LQDLRIPQEYQLYEYQPGLFESFLLAAREGQADNILLFGRNTNLDLLERSMKWYIDGTFRIAPDLFSQVLVLLAEEHGGVRPVIYGLLPNKTAMSYQLFFDILKRLKGKFESRSNFM